MNDRDNNRRPDPDRTEGSVKQMGGSLKEKAGNLMGDEKMKREGGADRVEGKLQNAWGGAKDSVRDAAARGRR
ncbi:MAG TPA: CsbD family protein [Allosphingosinicella sp.]|nr:CsbD family protein [Allosphingosinicella sp.]